MGSGLVLLPPQSVKGFGCPTFSDRQLKNELLLASAGKRASLSDLKLSVTLPFLSLSSPSPGGEVE